MPTLKLQKPGTKAKSMKCVCGKTPQIETRYFQHPSPCFRCECECGIATEWASGSGIAIAIWNTRQELLLLAIKALGTCVAAMRKASWQDGPSEEEAADAAHDAIHNIIAYGDPRSIKACPTCAENEAIGERRGAR